MATLIKPFVYIAIIIMGIALKKTGLFRDGDHRVLSAILLNITLPATVFYVFSGYQPKTEYLLMIPIGLVIAIVPVFLMYFLTWRMPVKSRAFAMINTSGNNIGAFVTPIILCFMGSAGAAAACMYDIGNAVVMAGAGFALTTAMLGMDEQAAGRHTRIKGFLMKLFINPTLDAYLIALALMLAHVTIPDVVGEIAAPIANANGYVAMMMIGLMFRVEKKSPVMPALIRVIIFRVIFGTAVALLVYFLLPFDEIFRESVALCAVGPAGSIAPVYTEKACGEGAAAGFCNSISIACSFAIFLLLVLVVFR